MQRPQSTATQNVPKEPRMKNKNKICVPRHQTLSKSTCNRIEKAYETRTRQASKKMCKEA